MRLLHIVVGFVWCGWWIQDLSAQESTAKRSVVQDTTNGAPPVFANGESPNDIRARDLRTLNDYFPMQTVAADDWPQRQTEIKRRILISQGLWPQPTKSNLNAVVHGRIAFEDYTVERVYFHSIPGHFVTGSLYRPKGKSGPFPAVLCPHGHWKDARFYDAGVAAAKQSIAIGAERFMNAARNHIQARCVQLARMGCVVFFYDMTGNCDSVQIGHRPDHIDGLNGSQNWGFLSTQAELRLQNMMGLQTWNSIRSIDFLQSLPDVDPDRIGVTGASGGGTQSMMIAAIDDRITAAMPCVMVSTAMQGGCTCENASLLRIDQGNVDIAAAIAPRPLALTAADDWTVELKLKGYPELRKLYDALGHNDRLTAAFNTHFKHNYNHVNRVVGYGFFNQHFKLGFNEPILERDFELMTRDDLTVWNEEHPAPSGDAIGPSHEAKLLKLATKDSENKINELIPDTSEDITRFHDIVGAAWETIIGRRFDQVASVQSEAVSDEIRNGMSIAAIKLTHGGEIIPVTRVHRSVKADQERGVVVWIGESGKNSLFTDGNLADDVQELAEKGYTILGADLYGQGECNSSGKRLEHQRMWHQRDGSRAWHRFSGYTFGYNHALFIQRTHDVLTLIKYARSLQNGDNVVLVGLGTTAGPIALAARSQAGTAVEETIIDVGGFRFADVARPDDPMFVPGAVRYLGVDGLLACCSQHRITIAGSEYAITQAVSRSAESTGSLSIVNSGEIVDAIHQLK